MGTITRKEPYDALGKKNGCIAAPIVYLISGFLVLPSVACLAFAVVLSDSIAAWGDLIMISVFILWPIAAIIALIIGAWAWVNGRRADSKRGPNEVSYVQQDGGLAGILGQMASKEQPAVKIEKPTPKSLPLGKVPWRIEGSTQKVGTITKK